MEPKREETKKGKPSRAELEARVAKFSELMRGKLKGHVDGDAEEYLFKELYPRTKKRRAGSHANP